MSEKVTIKREKKIHDMIASFIEVFCQEGLDGVSMRKLTAAANMTDSLVYRYFKNKEDIIRQCTVLHHERIQKNITEILIENINCPENMAEKLLAYVDSVLGTCRFLLQVMAHPTYCTMMDDSRQLVDRCIMQFAAEIQVKWNLSREKSAGIAVLLNSIINDYVLRKSRENFMLQFETGIHLFAN